jgi:F420-non-reducing hydrogenase iron-sulfur subunit
MRLQYPPEIKIILMPCTGRVDIIHLLKAFEAGADAVFVAGCLEGECHYLTGNLRAKKRVNKLKKDFEGMGLEPERLEMFNLSSSEGPRFAAIAKEMTERAYKLGPSPVNHKSRAAWLAEHPAEQPAATAAS